VIDVSIIIVSYNAAAELRRCLDSLHAAPPAAVHEIVVVDNGSRDGSVEVARRYADVTLVESPVNRGFAAANNEGIGRSSGVSILLLNSDTVVPAGAVDGLLQELHRHPDATIVGPRLVGETGVAELSFGPMMTPFNEWRQKRLMTRLARHDPAAVRYVDALTRREHWPDWVSGACLLVRRAEAEAVGLLDERFFMYTEDVDFCASVRGRGGRVLFTPAVEIVHSRGRSAAADPEATAAAYRRSHLAFYEKHHPALSGLLRLYKRIRASR
jgi:GT2 family glycosyltransferase